MSNGRFQGYSDRIEKFLNDPENDPGVSWGFRVLAQKDHQQEQQNDHSTETFRAGSQNQWVRFTARSQRPTVIEEQRRGFIWKKEIVKSLEQQMKLLECAPPSLLLEFSIPRVASSFSPPQPSSTVLLSSVEFLWLPPYISPHFTSTFHVTINNSKPRIPFSSYAYYFFSIGLLLISLPTSYSLIPWYIAIIRPCLFLTSLSVLTLLSQPQLWFNSTPLPSRGAVVWPKESFWSVWGQSVMTGLLVARKPCYTPPSDNLHFFLVIFNTPSLNHSAACLVTSYFTDKIEVIGRKLFYLHISNTTILSSPVSISPAFFSGYNT